MSATDRPPVDLVTLTPRERELWWDGYTYGYCGGHEAGAQYADDRAATLHYEAVRIVRRMAGMPEIDPEDTARRLALREARWTS
jgi:hypothetical protein